MTLVSPFDLDRRASAARKVKSHLLPPSHSLYTQLGVGHNSTIAGDGEWGGRAKPSLPSARPCFQHCSTPTEAHRFTNTSQQRHSGPRTLCRCTSDPRCAFRDPVNVYGGGGGVTLARLSDTHDGIGSYQAVGVLCGVAAEARKRRQRFGVGRMGGGLRQAYVC